MDRSSKSTPEKLAWFWIFFITRFRVVILLSLAIFFGGMTAYQVMPQENTPEVEIPIGIVTSVYPGASPQEMETSVTNVLENKIKSLENLKEYTSTSQNSFSTIVVEFETDGDLGTNIQNLKDAVDESTSKLPSFLPDDPSVSEASVSSIPILTLNLSGDYALSELKRFAETIEEKTEVIRGIRRVDISGIPEEAIHIYFSVQKLKSRNLSIDQILAQIRNANQDIPFGSLKIDGESIEVRGVGKLRTVEDFVSLPIRSDGQSTILLGEIATVRQEFDTQEVRTRSAFGADSQPSVTLDFVKSEAKANIAQISEQIFQDIQALKDEELLPENLQINTVFSSAEEISKSLNDLIRTGGQTIVIIALLLWIFLGWRESVLSFISVPLSMLGTILVLYLIGETFNFLSLFALILALGLLVDTAIIITEGISDNIRVKKMSPAIAAAKTISDFRWPVITGTLTTIFAFLPMIFLISGTSGDFIQIIPVAVGIMLTVSLLVSLFLLPSFAVLFFEKIPPKKMEELAIITRSKNWYAEKMDRLLHSGKKIALVLVASVLGIFSYIGLFVTGSIGVEVFPTSDENIFTIQLELPQGSEISETQSFVPIIDQILSPYFQVAEPWLDNYSIFVGQRSPYDPSVAQGGDNKPQSERLGVTVTLRDKTERTITSPQAAEEVRLALEEKIPAHVEWSVSQQASGPPGSESPIEIKITSQDLGHLEILAQKMQDALSAIKLQKNNATLKNIQHDFGERNKQLVWNFDREKLRQYGLSVGQLGQTLRTGLQGVSLFDIVETDNTLEVWARLDFDGSLRWDDPSSLENLAEIPIANTAGQIFSLEDIADFEFSNSIPVIRHIDGKRTVKISADINGQATPKDFDRAILVAFDSVDPLPTDAMSIGGDSEETDRLVREMGTAMIVALFLILLLLVFQFDSFSQPVVMIFLLPLSLTTVFWGFALTGVPVGFPTMIGIVALAGIMINDAIVFVDRYNRHRKTGAMTRPQALTQAGVDRFQPIFLTSVTTVFGLLPLALSDPVWAGLGFAIIFGMATSTITTLFILPCLLLVIQNTNAKIIQGLKRILGVRDTSKNSES
jgi:multidrug efflux pump subunit AcrB